MYAYDIIILANAIADLQLLMSICTETLKDLDMPNNDKKNANLIDVVLDMTLIALKF